MLVKSYKWEVCEVFYMLLHWRFFISAPINGIELELQWIRRSEIERADYISRIIDLDKWQISSDCFHVFRGSGVLSVDCFTSYY